MEETIIQQILSNFNLAYIICLNALTYFLIQFVDSYNTKKKLKSFYKRLILIISICIMFPIYYFFGDIEIPILINSTIAAPVIWGWILKPILNKFKLDYKKDNGIMD